MTFAICRRPSVCLSPVCLSSVMLVPPTQGIEIFGNVSTPFGTFAICELSVKVLRRSSQENPEEGQPNLAILDLSKAIQYLGNGAKYEVSYY